MNHIPISGCVDDERYQSLQGACESEVEQKVLEATTEEGYPHPDSDKETTNDDDGHVIQAVFHYSRDDRPQSIAVFVVDQGHQKGHIVRNDDEKRRRST
nr:hypothetical protein [Haloferax sp. BAB-2207]